MKLIGRAKEIKELENLYKSDSSEFVAVYGRRRVGKTFLIKELFKNRLTFWHTGLSPYDRDKTYLLRDQLQAFFYSLQDYGWQGGQCPKTWLEAFRMLQQLLIEKENGSRQVVFIDEMPWRFPAQRANQRVRHFGKCRGWIPQGRILYLRLNIFGMVGHRNAIIFC